MIRFKRPYSTQNGNKTRIPSLKSDNDFLLFLCSTSTEYRMTHALWCWYFFLPSIHCHPHRSKCSQCHNICFVYAHTGIKTTRVDNKIIHNRQRATSTITTKRHRTIRYGAKEKRMGNRCPMKIECNKRNIRSNRNSACAPFHCVCFPPIHWDLWILWESEMFTMDVKSTIESSEVHSLPAHCFLFDVELHATFPFYLLLKI